MLEYNACNLRFLVAILLVGTYAGSALGDQPEIAGVYGMESAGDGAWLAVRVPMPEGFALAGVQWYNNDGHTIFDEILVGTGFPDSPGLLADFVVAATGVQGASSTISCAEFAQPIAPSLDALYVVFAFPEGEQLTARGENGGPAVGYCAAADGLRGWLSGDGEIWAQLHDDYGFFVIPELVPADGAMLVKSMGGETEEIPVIEPFLSAGPNPFNPATEIRFGVSTRSRITLDVFDVRGRRVCRLVDGSLHPGIHQATWRGVDSDGRGVASGVYLIRLKGSGKTLKRAVTVIK
jgi:hypothetical protein